ncbi:hypothetical protein [Acholeplasma granularum]|uniref:hypothetical protein n=1 Tax=Acholeplasma granularum TaxID=264635 RepID=UPI00046EC0DD|nr:hypothetical protein [Acholeplasma granularum]
MKAFIHSTNPKQKIFYCVVNNKKEAFYLPNRLAKVFLTILKRGILVDFEVNDATTRKIDGKQTNVYPINHFNKIIQTSPKKVLYDLTQLRLDMKRVLKKYQYFLFLDLEMSMPGYKPGKHIPEIIQVGYLLTNKSGEVLKDNGYYVLPKNEDAINKRTIKFLNLDENIFYGKAREFDLFYDDLKDIINNYKPQIVTWGKNDIQALNISYKLHQVKPLTHDKQFIDLLKLHKDYFNLPNDIGLFDAYKKYYKPEDLPVQDHDARMDAIITKDVFDAFTNVMK